MYKASYDGTNKKVLWQEMWRHEFLEVLDRDPVVILPAGSVEQHGPHCPADVDISGPFFMAVEVAQRIDDFPVVVAPPLWCGVAHYNLGFPGTVSLRLETFQNLFSDILRSIHANGFKRIIVLNGHGGNTSVCRAVTWEITQEDIFALTFNWWDVVTRELRDWSASGYHLGHEGAIGSGVVGHAGEWETSLQLYLREHLVDTHRIGKDETGIRAFTGELAFAEFAERRRDTLQGTGIMGNALAASAEKGRRVFEVVCDRLERLAREYHNLPLRKYRQFGSHCP